MRRVSSTTSVLPVAAASRRTSSSGSGASQRRSTTRRRSPCSSEAAGRRGATGAGRWPTSRWSGRRRPLRVRERGADRDVLARSGTEPPRGRRPPRAGRARGTARSARGTRTRCRPPPPRPTQVRSIGRRVVGTGGRRDHEPRDVAQHAERVVVVEVTAEALLVAVARDPHDHPVAIRGPARRTAASPPRRAAGPRRCAGRRGTGSRGSARSRERTCRARARGSTSRRAACRRPVPRPKRACSPRVMP